MPPPVVTLYTRAGCHLCDEALRLLRELSPRLGFTVEAVDIETDDGLHRRFMFEIPVVAVDGEVIAQAPIRARMLESALRALTPPSGHAGAR